MIVTFPHMGMLHIPIKSLLSGLGLQIIPPPPITQHTMALGVKYAPECACLPLKINLGNFIEALENGADTIVMAGGWGPCRFGYYAQVEREILQDLGFKFQMVILEAPDSRISALVDQLKRLGERVTLLEAIGVIRFAWFKLATLERLERQFLTVLPRAVNKTEVEQIYDRAIRQLDEAGDRRQVEAAAAAGIAALAGCYQHKENILRIGLVGEVYTVLEPFCNCDIARVMGRLDVEITNSIQLTEWLNDNLFGGHLIKSRRKYLMRCAAPYLNAPVGGHGLETVGTTVDFARHGFDAVIQVGPLTCMPEIVAQTVLTRVAREEDIPCMTLYFDEQSGTAGIQTRLEAFVDMLKRQSHQGTRSCLG